MFENDGRPSLRKWIFAALLAAAGVLLSPAFSFPLGVTRAFPLQHMINIFLAVLCGDQIRDNAKEFVSTLIKLKPTAAKGTYIKSIYLSSTMSPGIKIDPKSVDEI